MYSETDRVIALAGIFQAAQLCWKIARSGLVDKEPLQASLSSLFQTSPKDVASVFNGMHGVRSGLDVLRTQLDDPTARNIEVTSYAISLMKLERALAKQPEQFEQMTEALDQLQHRLQDFALSESSKSSQLAEIYSQFVSHLSPHIMVRGEPVYLQNPDNIARIRATLLAGIRAAHLWRQCGGRKWHLILRRRQIAQQTRRLLQIF